NTSGLIYIPLFTRSHWIAGVFSLSSQAASLNNINEKQQQQQRKTYVLRVYDSAPPPPVERDVRRSFRPYDGIITVDFAPIVRQVRSSEDCGVFMSMHFFAFAAQVNVHITPCLTKMVRRLFGTVLRHCEEPPARAVFLSRLKNLLELRTDMERQNLLNATIAEWRQRQHQQHPTMDKTGRRRYLTCAWCRTPRASHSATQFWCGWREAKRPTFGPRTRWRPRWPRTKRSSCSST
ncbi:TATE DNA Transposon, partial [Trypanosoma theileri]